MFNSSNAQNFGRKGGSTKSTKKQRAAKANGKKGGRPAASLFFMDQLLSESIHPSQFKYVLKAYAALYESEKQELKQHFDFTDIMNEPHMRESKLRRMPKRIRYLIERFRLAFRYYQAAARPPTPYVVEYKEREGSQKNPWERKDMPVPPQRYKTDVRTLPYFTHIAWEYSTNPKMTIEDVKEIGGGPWYAKRAEVALAWLRVYVPLGISDFATLREKILPHMTD
jgi:hypothetical protein